MKISVNVGVSVSVSLIVRLLLLVPSTNAKEACIIERTHNSLVRDMDCFKRTYKDKYEEKLRKFSPGVSLDGSVCNVHQCNATTDYLRTEDPENYKGHLQFFGKQGQPRVPIDIVEGCLDGATFLKEYTYKHKPVLMKGCAFEMEAVDKWTDEYFLKHKDVREWTPIVETQKTISRNDRGPHIFNMTFEEFLKRYKTDPFYVINTVTNERLRDDIKLPKSMQCARTLKQIDDIHLWFSSGGTESSQHFDTHDNLLAMIDGSKHVLMTDPIHSLGLYMDYHDKFGLSPINVRKIDLTVYPLVKEVPIVEVNITKGDVLYIPTHWWHQINSFKDDTRNIALSMGWHGFFPVHEQGSEDGFRKDKGMKSFGSVPHSDGLFSLELAEWSNKIRNLENIHQMAPEDVCGGQLDTKLSDTYMHDPDGNWYSYGLGGWGFTSPKDWFTEWVIPQTRNIHYAAEKGLDVKHLKAICDYKITWILKDEVIVTDFSQDLPMVSRMNSRIERHVLDESDIIIRINQYDRFLQWLTTSYPEKDEYFWEFKDGKCIDFQMKPGLFDPSDRKFDWRVGNAMMQIPRCFSQLNRMSEKSKYMSRDNPRDMMYKAPYEREINEDGGEIETQAETCSSKESCKLAQTSSSKHTIAINSNLKGNRFIRLGRATAAATR